MSSFQGKVIFTVLSLIAVHLITASCSKNTLCDESMNSSANLQFYRVTNQVEEEATFDNITVYGILSDSLLYDLADNLSSIALPLNHLQDSCIFVLSIESIADTLKLKYSRKLDFVSENCGYATLFEIHSLETTNNLIDSTNIINPVINTTESENIKIYY